MKEAMPGNFDFSFIFAGQEVEVRDCKVSAIGACSVVRTITQKREKTAYLGAHRGKMLDEFVRVCKDEVQGDVELGLGVVRLQFS